jgi:hypothetical protein
MTAHDIATPAFVLGVKAFDAGNPGLPALDSALIARIRECRLAGVLCPILPSLATWSDGWCRAKEARSTPLTAEYEEALRLSRL